MIAPPKETVVHYRAADACVASFGHFILFRCFGDVGASAVNASIAAHRAAIAARPEGVVSIVLIDATTKFPSEEMRRAGVAARKQTNGHVTALATVIAGEGFWASTIRGVLTAINSLSGSSYPTKVFRDPLEGVTWAAEQSGVRDKEQVDRIARELDALVPHTAGA